ncbi:alpha/beta hydrolase [Reyranella sp. MMS21-HV4-11]|jgi:pimeloyl-ACP methyl ester carboxylesterase|uniref:Alpha/beta hydrolase n=1 Tax=Reyranella humidisoli TaxID=2849149 RepID=A0ABS6INN8_9HYPH|nr:alpha/beta hydrolase [Reyranella sp. MMS21-HV4-11]MBU8876218.1 alpha/beta hydrolase [Reyranella sp. MMS21-HV4-11]
MSSYAAPPRTVGRLKRPFGDLHYEVSGSGPALLFAHGLGGNHLSWWQQVAHFAPNYTCVAFAHRGFAPSGPVPSGVDPADYAGDLAALIDHLGFPDVRLVAQSMGGWTMLEYALAHQDRVKALVLSSTSGTIDRRGADPSGGSAYDAWLAKAEATIADGMARGIHPAIGEQAARRFPDLHLLYRSIDEMAGTLDKEKLRAGLRRTAKRTLGEFKTFRVPTLLIAGGEDIVFPPFLASAIAASLPCGEAETISDAGHSPYFEQAARFNALVDAFLARQRQEV